MLAPTDRKLYSECFAAPPGYKFDCALGTTYSLDLESLLFALFCLASSGNGEPEEALREPVGLLEAIHRTVERVTVFCHAGETNVPDKPQSLYSLLEQCIVPARGRGGGAIFHPKLWLFRYSSRDTDEILLRAVVLSRNLTTSRAWDSFICLEGSPDKSRQPDSGELAELIRALPSLSTQPVHQDRAATLESLARDAERTIFKAPSPFTGNATFLVIGTDTNRKFQPTEKGDKVLAISPFVSPNTLDELRKLAPEGTLLSRPEEMSKCPAEVIERWRAFSIHEGACSDAELADDSIPVSSADPVPQGLHAKALAVQSASRTTWWIGSGNLTDPVRNGSSVELMLCLEGKTASVGIDAFLEAGFQKLLVDYHYCSAPHDPQDCSRSAVEKTKLALIDAKLELTCLPDGDHWALVLTGLVRLAEIVTVTCRPISLPVSHAQRLSPESTRLQFDRLRMEDLTALFCFELTAGSGKARFEQSLALKLPIEGLPQERDARIARSIVKDRTAFLSYLRCLLSNSGDDLLGAPVTKRAGDRHGNLEHSAAFASGLLEHLLRTLHSDPERLRGIPALLQRTNTTEGGEASTIPEEFRQIWAVIEPHLAKREAPST